jgi:peptide/nickel transport system substrate-binding protein
MRRRSLLASGLVLGAPALPRSAGAQSGGASGGVLRATLNANLNNLDPARAGIAEDYVYSNLVFNGLTRIDEDRKLHPDLAESWDSSPDLKSWTFRLRRGVKFHHGREMTSADVLATYRRILDPSTGSPGRSQILMVARVEAPDDHTVRFDLSIPYGDFPSLLMERQLKIIPADRLDKLSTEPSGTGPFRFVSFQPGDRLVLERNPDYFEQGFPKLAGVTFRIIPEDAAKVAALKAGDIDMIWNVPLEAVEGLEREQGIKVDEATTGTWDGLVLSNIQKPFDDTRVRRAVLLALDKAALVRFAVFGRGAPTHTPIPPGSPFFNSEIGFRPNIAEAKRLLAEAGYPNGFSVPLIVPVGRPTRERMGLAVQQMLRPLGIQVELRRLPYNRFNAEVTGKAVFYADGYFARPTADTATYPWFHSTGTWNSTMWHYKNEEVDRLLDAARAARTPEEQATLYKRFQQVVTEDPPGIIAYMLNFATAYRTRLKGYRTHPYAWLDLRNATLEG